MNSTLTDIEKEMSHYHEHFRGKTVFCNCDDPAYSNFWRYFHLNFNALGLKKLISTHYDPVAPTYKLEYTGGNDENVETGTRTNLMQNGDFLSPECIELLKEADIVVTNPPFSRWRIYIEQLMEYKKKFIVIGNINAITYKEFFPLLKDDRVWVGNTFNKTLLFQVPDTYSANIEVDGQRFVKVPAICWFTNLDHKKRHEPIILFRSYAAEPERFPKYDNYDAVEVSRTDDIPFDYDGVMGVPITFLDKYCPEQFEIVGIAKRGAKDPVLKTHIYTKEEYPNYSNLNAAPTLWVNGALKILYPRILIRRREGSNN